MKTIFEVETCSRCGGSGKYSFCEMWGNTCFKCRGSGKVHTKRATVALAFLNKSLEKSVSELAPGMRIRVDGKLEQIFEIRHDSGNRYLEKGVWLNYVQLVFGKSSLCTFPSHTFRVIDENYNKKLEDALNFQNSLTKSGTPRKHLTKKRAW